MLDRKIKNLYYECMKKRWYDIDPTVSRAVAELEKAEEYIQVRCAVFILVRLKDIDFNIEMWLDDEYNYIMRRW